MTSRLYWHKNPRIVFQARVNITDPMGYPFTDLSFDTVTLGSVTDIYPGMTLWLGTAAGLDDLGRQRVSEATHSNFLRVGLTSIGTHDGELTVHDNDYITVVEEFRVWAKIPQIFPSGTIFKDGWIESYQSGLYNLVDQPPPVANTGTAMAGTIDPSSGKLRVAFDGSNSFQFDPSITGNISGARTFQWSAGDGVIVAGAANSANVTYDFGPGFRYVHLTVTSDQGIAHAAHVPVFARDPANDQTLRHQVSSHTITPAGQQISWRILDPIPRDTYKDGALLMMWEEDEPVPESDSFYPQDRMQVRFVGWASVDNTTIQNQRTASVTNLTVSALDVGGRLAQLPGFPQFVKKDTTPQQWSETKYPNILYYIWYLVYWHSSALEVADLLMPVPSINHAKFLELSSEENSIFQQVEDLATKVTPDYHFCVTRQGEMKVVADPLLMYYLDRDLLVNTAHVLDENDITDIAVEETPFPRVNQLYSGAIVAADEYVIVDGVATVATLFCKAPSYGRGQGLQAVTIGERIATNQGTLNNCEGNRYARMNAPIGRVSLTVSSQRLPRFLDPADMQWLALRLYSSGIYPAWYRPPAGSASLRGIIHEMNIRYDYQPSGVVKTASITWEAETWGPPAQTFVPDD